MPSPAARPNVVILYADDLGYGDVGCYGATRVATPNVDRLAASGIRFDQGYATAATCTPSRYSLLTGSYPWRNPHAAILAGDAPCILPPGAGTLPRTFRRAGYRTAAIGKWHLGLGAGDLDWNRPIHVTPNDAGFDQSFIMAATNDRVPCVYIQDRTVVDLDPRDPIEVTYDPARAFPEVPAGRTHPELLRLKASHGHDGTIVNGVGRIGFMRGGRRALWNDETMAEVFAERAVCFVEQNRDRPFFLYYALHQPHVPRLPGARFRGAAALGARGDVIAEMDWCVGQVLDALARLKLRERTIVLFTSDNGPVLDDGYDDEAVRRCGDHRPAGPLRGGKYSIYDGGTRVPFLLSWPGTVPVGRSAAMVSQVDLLASCAALLGQPLDGADAPDSVDVLAALLGQSARGRDELVVEGTRAKTVLRWRQWAYIPAHDGPAVSTHTGTELGNSASPQLYDLGQDLGQMRDLAGAHPEVADRLAARLESIRASASTRLADGTGDPP